MKHSRRQSLLGYLVVFIGALISPLLPFALLVVFPVVAVLSGAPIVGLLFAILIDSFLVPGGLIPVYVSSVLYTALSFLLYVYLRYTAP